MTTQAIAVQFHDQSLTAAIIDSIPYVAMKPICENIGIQWHGQLERIKRHPVLNSVIRMTRITASDGKLYEMAMLPLDYLNGWLFGVDTNRVKNGTREKLIEYQRECFKVLANHFMPALDNQLSRNPLQLPEPPTRIALSGCLTLEQQDTIKALVKTNAEALPKDKQAGAVIRQWAAIKKKFGCTYKEVSADNYINILSLLSRLPFDGELLDKEEQQCLTVDLKFPTGMQSVSLKFNTDGYNFGRWTMTLSGGEFSIKTMEANQLCMTEEEWITHMTKEHDYVVIKKDELINRIRENLPKLCS